MTSLASRHEIAVAEILRQRLGLESRHRQQLLDQVRCAVDAVFQFGQRRGARGGVGRALRELDLQLQRGERRAQFVRGVGGEAALRVERVVESARAAR